MKKKSYTFTLLLIFIFVIVIPLQSSAKEFLINESFYKSPVNKYLSYYEDKTGHLTIEDIVDENHTIRFKKFKHYRHNIGYSKSAFWFRIKTGNLSEKTVKWMLESSYPLIDSITVFTEANGLFERMDSGDSIPFKDQIVKYRKHVFPLVERPGSNTRYIRLKTSGALIIKLEAYSMEAFHDKRDSELPYLWLYYGVMFALIIYNLFVYFSFKDKSYIYISVFILAITVYSMIFNGIAQEYLWPSSSWWSNHSNPVFIYLACASTLLFSKSFLNLKHNVSSVDKMMNFLLLFYCFAVITSFFIDYYYSTQISVMAISISVILCIISGIISVKRKVRYSYFFMFTWATFLIGAFLVSLMVYSVIPENFLSNWWYQIGSTIAAFLLPLGLTNRIIHIQRQRESAVLAMGVSEKKYKAIVENANDGVLLILDGMPVYANRRLIEFSGYTEKEFYSMKITNHFAQSKETEKIIWKRYTNRLEGIPEPERYEIQAFNKDHQVMDVLISSTIIEIDNRLHTIAIISNISDLKKAIKTIEKQYEEIQQQYKKLDSVNDELNKTHDELIDANKKINIEKEQLSATLCSIGEAVIAYDKSEKIIFLNEVAEKLTGWEKKESLGKSIREIVNITDIKSSEYLFDDLIPYNCNNNINLIEFPFTLVDKSGKEHIIEVNSSVIAYPSDQNGDIVLAIRDITDKYMLDREIQKMNKIESLGVLAGGMAHDFNNLLTAIIGNTSIAKSFTNIEPALSTILEKIDQAGKRAANLTRQILTFSKGGAPVKKISDIGTVIRESAELVVAGPNITCNINIQEGIWSAEIDTDQINQVFDNILINAVQSMENAGAISIDVMNFQEVSQELPLPTGKYLKISISDSGPGISQSNINRIFDPFFTTKKNGTGLGLASSYSIIKKHGGHITVNSVTSSGTTFNIYLPASEKAPVKDDTTKTKTIKHHGRILLMDDEKYIIDVASRMINHLGYDVESVTDGFVALNKYIKAFDEKKPFHAVIVDLTIPGGMGGLETIKKLLEFDPDVKAVVSSGYSDDPVMANYTSYGFKEMLIKPYRIDDIERVIINLFDKANGETNENS